VGGRDGCFCGYEAACTIGLSATAERKGALSARPEFKQGNLEYRKIVKKVK
jgi:hypothetical protein